MTFAANTTTRFHRAIECWKRSGQSTKNWPDGTRILRRRAALPNCRRRRDDTSNASVSYAGCGSRWSALARHAKPSWYWRIPSSRKGGNKPTPSPVTGHRLTDETGKVSAARLGSTLAPSKDLDFSIVFGVKREWREGRS